MRLNVTSITTKRSVKNNLSTEQMNELAKRGLADLNERIHHDVLGYSVEELMFVLPESLTLHDKTYILKLWVSAFGVPHVGYVHPSTPLKEYLISVGLDDVAEGEVHGNLVDAMYKLLIDIDDFYPQDMVDVKEMIILPF